MLCWAAVGWKWSVEVLDSETAERKCSVESRKRWHTEQDVSSHVTKVLYHACGPAGDISSIYSFLLCYPAIHYVGWDTKFTVCFSFIPLGYIIYCFILCFFVCPQIFRNGYLRHGLSRSDEIWQDGRPGWVAGHLLFGELWPRVSPPKTKKWTMLVTHWTVASQVWQTGRWQRCVWLAPLAMQPREIGTWGYTPLGTG